MYLPTPALACLVFATLVAAWLLLVPLTTRRVVHIALALLGTFALLFAGAVVATAQVTPTQFPVTGNLTGIQSTNNDLLQARISLVNCMGGPATIPGITAAVKTSAILTADTSGNISTTLWGNNAIVCKGSAPTLYQVTYLRNNIPVASPSYYRITDATDLTTADTIPVAPPTYPLTAAEGCPTGQVMTGLLSNFTPVCTIVSPNSIIYGIGPPSASSCTVTGNLSYVQTDAGNGQVAQWLCYAGAWNRQGNVGPTGAQGIQGPQGIQGIQGLPGAPNPNGNVNVIVAAGESIAAAVARCPATGGCSVSIPMGQFPAGAPITRGDLTISGFQPAQYPVANDDSGFIPGSGSIVLGQLDIGEGVNNVTVQNLSLDIGTASGYCNATTDGLTIDATGASVTQNITIRNVRTLLCDLHGVHSIFASNVNHLTYENVESRHGAYGAVAFGTNIKMDGLASYANGAACWIVKSANVGANVTTSEVEVSNSFCTNSGAASIFSEGNALTDMRVSGMHVVNSAGLVVSGTVPTRISIDGYFNEGLVGSNPTGCSSGIIITDVSNDVTIDHAFIDGCSYAGILANPGTGVVTISHSFFTNITGKGIISGSAQMYLSDVTFGTAATPMNDYAILAEAGTVYPQAIHGYEAQASFFLAAGGTISPLIYPGDTYAVGYFHAHNENHSTGVAGEPMWGTNPFVTGMDDFNNNTTTPGMTRYYYGAGLNFATTTEPYGCAALPGQVYAVYRNGLEGGTSGTPIACYDANGNHAVSGSESAQSYGFYNVNTGTIVPGFTGKCTAPQTPTMQGGIIVGCS